MKCVLALVLLHLCHTVVACDLNNEIIDGLDELSMLCKKSRVNFTSPHTVLVPGREMNKNPTSCVGVFGKELRNLLNNVTGDEEAKIVLQELMANLNALEAPQEVCHNLKGNALEAPQESDRMCKMKPQKNLKLVFGQYLTFLRKLNNKK